MEELDQLTGNLGIAFHDRDLLVRAVTHRSFVNETPTQTDDNERLEFLGDAVIDYIVGAYLFRRFPDMREGEMTALRAALVRAETLADFALQLGIDRALRLGHGEDMSGGRTKIATLSAAFEAVIGAAYLDQGMDAVRPSVERLVEPALHRVREQALHKDAKSEFQVWAQAEFGSTPTYEVSAESGPDHAKEFTVDVLVEEQVWGTGSGRSKRQAAQEAAAAALARAGLPGWNAEDTA